MTKKAKTAPAVLWTATMIRTLILEVMRVALVILEGGGLDVEILTSLRWIEVD